MSISDIIVVMKLGVVQQVGKPQDVYDDPTNLFVAKFLGTPPINVFEGYVKGEKLYIGGTVTPVIETEEVEEAVTTDAGTETVIKTVENIIGYDYEGGECVLNVPGIDNRAVTVGIRPEGFILDKNGPLTCKVSGIEVMGRDVSIVSTHESSLNPVIRSIMNSDAGIDAGAGFVNYSLKPNKVLVFDKETEERLYFEVK